MADNGENRIERKRRLARERKQRWRDAQSPETSQRLREEDRQRLLNKRKMSKKAQRPQDGHLYPELINEDGEYERDEKSIHQMEIHSDPYTGLHDEQLDTLSVFDEDEGDDQDIVQATIHSDICAVKLQASGSEEGVQDPLPQSGRQEAGGKQRAPNYKHKEMVVLLRAIRERPTILAGGREVKPGPRAEAWKEVAAAVTAVGYAERDVRSVKHRFDDIRAKMRRMMAKEDSAAAAPSGGPQVIVKYNEWERVLKDMLSQVPVAGAPGLVAQQDPASMSAGRKNGFFDEPQAGASSSSEQDVEDHAPTQQDPEQEEEARREVVGPGYEKEDQNVWVVGLPAGPLATPMEFGPTIPLQQLGSPPRPSYWPDYSGFPPPPPSSSATPWLPPSPGPPPPTSEWSHSPVGPQPLHTGPPPPPPPHAAMPTHTGLPSQSPPPEAAQGEMLNLMRQFVESNRGIQASVSSNHTEIVGILRIQHREMRRHQLIVESYLAGLLQNSENPSALN
ncbi:uncharacterized protein O3C94_019768 [Discoglossus pictus]